jgi:stearoyl-CoA desaturase (delta-9 desaturase)
MRNNTLKPNLISQLDWIPVTWLTGSVALALLGLFICEYHLKTFLLAFFFYYIGGIGITSGYHRLWSHRSYQAALPAKLVLLFMGTSAFEGKK